MTTRNKLSACFLAAGLVFTAAGVALGSTPWAFIGLMVVALAVRYRKNPPPWEYLCFVALALAMGAWGLFRDTQPSPVVGAIPLMLSYVLDYLDERRQRRATSAGAALKERASNGGRPAETAAPNVGPAASSVSSEAGKGPPAVS